jgi:hypothetical protein
MSSILQWLGGQELGNRNLGHPLPAGVSRLGWIEDAIGWPTLVAPRADIVVGGYSAGPRYDQGYFEMAVLRRREPTKAVNQAEVTDPVSASSVRRPLQVWFEPPADPGNWRMTGRINWPSPSQGYALPICEWTNNEGMRIWLSAQLKDLAVEFSDRAPDRLRGLAVRGRELVASVKRRCGDHSLFVTLCYYS